MAPDINQNDLSFGNFQGQGYPVTMGKTDGVRPLQLSLEIEEEVVEKKYMELL